MALTIHDIVNKELPLKFCQPGVSYTVGMRYSKASNVLDTVVNGVVEKSIVLTGSVNGSPTYYRIGNNMTGIGAAYGHFRNLRIYDRTLTDAGLKLA